MKMYKKKINQLKLGNFLFREKLYIIWDNVIRGQVGSRYSS